MGGLRRRGSIVSICCILLVAGACSRDTEPSSDRVEQTVGRDRDAPVPAATGPARPAGAEVEPVDAARAREMVRSGALLIDVREPHELAESGWLEGAINRPMSTFGKQAAALPRDRPIVLYCRSGRRSGVAGDVLTSLGFTRVYNLGGFEAAARAGMATAAR